MGSSVGTSAVTTILARRAQFHQEILASHTGLGDRAFDATSSALANQLGQAGASQPQMQAYHQIYRAVQNQASTLSYIDTFWMLGIASGIMFLLSFLLKKNNPRAKVQVVAH
jgi:DHA2 family multidrug resistance protein